MVGGGSGLCGGGGFGDWFARLSGYVSGHFGGAAISCRRINRQDRRDDDVMVMISWW